MSVPYLVVGQKLLENQSVVSPAYKYSLTQQTDGNLVLYENSTGRATWHANSGTGRGNFTVLQSDGNFAVYTDGGDAVWAAGSNRDNFDGVLVVKDDGGIYVAQQVFDVTKARARGS